MRIIVVMAALLVILIPATCSALPDHVVLYFGFNEGQGDMVTDLSKNGNDGKIIGNQEWADGQFGKALRVDGSSTVVIVEPPSDEMKALEPPMSVGAWFQLVSFPSRWQLIIEMEGTAGDRKNGWQYALSNQNPNFCTLGHVDHIAGNITLEAGEWIYLAMVTDGSNVDFYVNGDLAQQIPFGGIIDVTQSPTIQIGAEGGVPGTNYSDVIMDELWVSNKALSKDEIKEFMEPEIISLVDSQGKLATTWGDVKSR